jgi:beta-galactosidase
MPTRRHFLFSAALLPALPATAQSRAPILDRIRIGAEFFLNANETRESVFHHFSRMRETGLTVARIFTLWDHIEPEQGRWDLSRYDWIYDAAAQNGIFIANTLCAEDPPGWMRTAPFYHAWHDLSDPALHPYSEIYIERVVNRYKNHPAHGVWLLQNEPGIRQTSPPPAWLRAEYAIWLEARYKTIANLNALWYQKLRAFSDATAPVEARAAGWADYPSNLDWRRFQCDHLAAQQRWIHAQIDRHHPGALTHINPPGLTSNMPASGRDLWRLKPTAHFLGASMHAAWHFTMFPREDFGVAYSYCCDLIRSVSAPAPWWVTELQAGPTVFTGSRPLNPTAGEITRWLWDAVGNGTRGVVFWLWHPRTEGNEAGEWALAGANGEPTPRTVATRTVAQVLEKHSEFFLSAKPVPSQTAILYNRETLLLYAVDGWRRPADEAMHSLMGCYKALHRRHVAVDFIESSELEAGAAAKYKTLYLPYSYALTARSCEALRGYVQDGGTIWADGLVAWKDEQGRSFKLPPGPLSDVFGFTLDDIDARWDSEELWRCVVGKLAPTAKVLQKDAAGRTQAVTNAFGKGRAIYYNSALAYACLRRETPEIVRAIAEPALANSTPPVTISTPLTHVSARILEAPNRVAVILNSWGAAGPVTLRFPTATQATDLLTGARLPTSAGQTSITLRAGATVIAVFRL